MNEEPRLGAIAGLIAALVVFGAIGWWLHFRPVAELDPATIEKISSVLDGWNGIDIPISEGVEQLLHADSQIQRAYVNASGELVWLYVGYYGTARGGRPEHTPWACYPSAGWRIESEAVIGLRAVSTQAEGSRDDEANEILVERDGERRLVHFWYATYRRVGVASELALTLDHLAGRMSKAGRADGALVRISTPIGSKGVGGARDRLRRFKEPLLPEIRRRWPSADLKHSEKSLASKDVDKGFAPRPAI